MRSVIRGTGMYVPDNVVDNHQLSKVMDTDDEWIQARTGIVERRFASADQAASDMAAPAAKNAIKAAGLGAGDIDCLVLATMTPDCYFPGSGPFVQQKLGLEGNIPCFDIRQQCTGFVYALQIADALIRSEQYRTVLVIGTEVHAALQPWQSWDIILGESDREVSAEEYELNTRYRDRTVLFGDGAGAVVLRASEDDGRGVLDTLLYTDGNLIDKLWTDAGGSRYRPYFRPEMTIDGSAVPVVKGREVFKWAVTLMPQVVLELLERNQLTLDDVDLLIMHQANLRICDGVQKRLGLPDERVFNNIQRYGNTTAATIPIALHEAWQAGRIHDGDLLCFVALGSGLNWGANLYRV
jgi:3-oxoacyl-[acyl-carrier-protein] synthase-3